MANEKNIRQGLVPINHTSAMGSRTNPYVIADDYGTDIFQGDPVKMLANGTIGRANAGDVILGVFSGCQYQTDEKAFSTYSSWYPKNTTPSKGKIVADVYDDPDEIFIIRAKGDFQQTNVGNCADVDTTTAGDTTFGKSGVELATAMGAGTAQLKIMRLDPETANNEFGTNANVQVRINEHFYRTAAGI